MPLLPSSAHHIILLILFRHTVTLVPVARGRHSAGSYGDQQEEMRTLCVTHTGMFREMPRGTVVLNGRTSHSHPVLKSKLVNELC